MAIGKVMFGFSLLLSPLVVSAYTRKYTKVVASLPQKVSNTLVESVSYPGVTYRFACAQKCNEQHCCCLACVTDSTCHLYNAIISKDWNGSNDLSALTFDSCYLAKLKSPFPIFPNSSLDSGTVEDSYVGIDVNESNRNCLDIQRNGYSQSGVYNMFPRECCSSNPVSLYCDMDTDGGGWTVIQRRRDIVPREDFFRTWEEYVQGFGDLPKGEFWLGLDNIHDLSAQTAFELRIDLADFEGETRWAKYSQFYVDSRTNFYTLTVTGYSGDAGDAMAFQNGAKFSAKDKDLDNYGNNCAELYKGGWWYNACHYANLNGLYILGYHSTYAIGINWRPWHGYDYSLKETTMMIRPVN